MVLIIGLGNPGTKYQKNRHNVGQMLVDYLLREDSKLNEAELRVELKILKTKDTFMNDSGIFVRRTLDYYKISTGNLYLLHDDLDLRVGEYKIQLGVGPKVHNGVNSVEGNLKSKGFWRVRVGVDNRDSNNRMAGESYVLEDFGPEELAKLKVVFGQIDAELANIFQNEEPQVSLK